MELVTGISHVATVTEDLDRMIGFYERVFEASTGEVMEEDGLRHALIFVGEQVALHPFEVPGVTLDGHPEMFDRGRIDHFGLTVPTVDALLEVRRRLLAEDRGNGASQDGAATDAQIRDLGALYSLHYEDPDGVQLEVNLFKDDWTELEVLERADWTIVELEPASA
jgi:catechol 2,3-dioxygenase-like lactoylglutathione lyase family enzyme